MENSANSVMDADTARKNHVGAVLVFSHHLPSGDQVEYEAERLEPRDSSQSDRGEERVLQPKRGEKFDEEGKEVFAHPKRMNVRDDFVNDAQAPKQGPKPDNGQSGGSVGHS